MARFRSFHAAGRSAVLGLIFVTLVSCGGMPAGGGGAAGDAAAESSASEGAPDFQLESVAGDPVQLSDSAGQVRLIDFWATWCAPCREEIPMFKELYQTYGSRGFTILAISDESSDVIRDFVESNGIPYPNLVDSGEVSKQYGVLALPSAYLIDGEGKIVETFIGPKPRKVLEAMIVELLEKQPAT